MDAVGCSVVYLQAESQIKIAVIEGSIPADADLVPAHQPLYRLRVEGLSKEVEVVFLLVLSAQFGPESSQRHVREGQEAIKPDAEALAQFSPVILLKG